MIINLLAPYFERYITINRVIPGQYYNYVARGFQNLPVVDISMHLPKCSADSWLYVAVRAGADLRYLEPKDKLYIGSQTADRMFRGDGLGGGNFHHAEMRKGNGDRNLIRFLQEGERVDLHRLSAARISDAIENSGELSRYRPLLTQPKQPKKHIGYWFEQLVLHHEIRDWKWNTASAARDAKNVFATL